MTSVFMFVPSFVGWLLLNRQDDQASVRGGVASVTGNQGQDTVSGGHFHARIVEGSGLGLPDERQEIGVAGKAGRGRVPFAFHQIHDSKNLVYAGVIQRIQVDRVVLFEKGLLLIRKQRPEHKLAAAGVGDTIILCKESVQ